MKSFDVCIIGAGYSGICAGIKLQQELNISNFVMFDENDGIGGTWLVNSYPGCACDIQSHLYSFSFELNPDWPESYSSFSEIWQYINGVVDKYNIRKNIQLRKRVILTEWVDSRQQWKVVVEDLNTSTTKELHFDIIINGVGGLRMPNKPAMYENTSFKGKIVHTAEWDHSLDLSNKTVAVVGTGASAVQVIPGIVDSVKKLAVFQRNAPWTVTRGQMSFPWLLRKIFRYVPFVMRAYRNTLFWLNDFTHSAFRVGSLFSALGPLNHYLTVWWYVKDPVIKKLLTPTYAFGCKRIVKTDDFIPALVKPNVSIHTERIERLDETGLVKTSGQHVPVDVIVLATGFRVHDYFAPMRIIGRDGLDVLEMWRKESPKGYYGMCAHQIPNNFVIIGPGTGLGHNSIIFMIECQVNYIIQLLRHMMKEEYRTVEVKEAAQNAFGEYLRSHLRGTVWASANCKSWYSNDKGEVTALWPHSSFAYWRHTCTPKLADFHFTSREEG